jgi:VCBS repeat protein
LKAIGVEAASQGNQIAVNDHLPDPELPESERKYIWDIEHNGNLLVKHGLKAFAQALKNADSAALSRLMSDNFSGLSLRDPRHIQSNSGSMQVERLEDAGHEPTPLTRDGFVKLLLELRGTFAAAPPQAKFALMTLNPKVRKQFDGAWECTTQLRMHGEHARGAPAEIVATLRFEFGRPTEESLSKPGWLRGATVLQVQTAKASRYLFVDVAKQRGFDTSKLYDNWKSNDFVPSTGGVYVCDFDHDGILDVLITDFNTSLYRGRPDGTFEDVTVQFGLPQQTAARPTAAWIDIDGDGWEDLILAGRIYRNEQGKRFSDYTEHSNLRLPSDANNIVIADYDRDGKLDLYVTRVAPPGKNAWLDGRSGEARGNMLFRNLGDWQFENTTKKSGTFGGNRSTFTAAWLDANNDGWPDLHVINEFGDGGLYINNGDGTFAEHPLANRPADFGSMGLAVGDINNDGNIDIFCANMYSKAGNRVISNLAPDAYPPAMLEKMHRFVDGSQLHLNKGGLKFEQVGKKMQVAAVGWSYGACLADLDNDGWLDIYATAGYLSRNRDEPDG